MRFVGQCYLSVSILTKNFGEQEITIYRVAVKWRVFRVGHKEHVAADNRDFSGQPADCSHSQKNQTDNRSLAEISTE